MSDTFPKPDHFPRPSNLPNIYIVGAQCTGKTTIINRLKTSLSDTYTGLEIGPPSFITEVARTVLKQNPIPTEEIRSSPEKSLLLQQLILSAQVRREREALSTSTWYVSDRSAIDPIVYATMYVGKEAARRMLDSAEWAEAKDRMARSLVLVCEAGVTWLTDDGVRLMPTDEEDWIALHRLFCQTLDKVGVQYCILPRTVVDLEERVLFVKARWEEMVIG